MLHALNDFSLSNWVLFISENGILIMAEATRPFQPSKSTGCLLK